MLIDKFTTGGTRRLLSQQIGFPSGVDLYSPAVFLPC